MEMRFDFLAIIIPVAVVAALLLVIIIDGMPRATPEQAAVANTGGLAGKDHHPPHMHTRPICEDSTFFRVEVGGKTRSCGWFSHNPAERCAMDVKGKDNNGNHVLPTEACFATCDTGNCRRRRMRGTGAAIEQELQADNLEMMMLVEEEQKDLN